MEESLPNEVLRTAMDVALQWGPERLIPEPDRIRKNHPNLSDEEVQAARNVAYAVLTEAMNVLAPLLRNETISRDEAILRLRLNRIWLTKNQALRAVNQGEYYFWRENGA